jgi:GrpB-like predicted nucleotidyltransferase (UPF0157 family)
VAADERRKQPWTKPTLHSYARFIERVGRPAGLILDDPNDNYRLWFSRPSPSVRTHHLQVIQYDHPNLRALIAFRDALRQDPQLRMAYSSLKEDLARKHKSDRNAYSNAKTEFVRSVLEAAGVGRSWRTPV